jgi:biotin carboxyl carrier protein
MILDVQAHGRRYVVETAAAPDGLLIRYGEQAVVVRLEPAAGAECWWLTAEGRTVPVRLRASNDGVIATLGPVRVPVTVRRWLPVPSRRHAAGGGNRRIEIRAPMPGLVVETRVTAGDSVPPGRPVAIVEAMKMQMEVPSPSAGRVEEVRVRPGQEVAGGQVLVVVRPEGDATPDEGRA